MDFLRSFKLVITFVLLCFSSAFGSEVAPKLPTVDSIDVIGLQLAQYLVSAESSAGRLIHAGINSVAGTQFLLRAFSSPVSLIELKERQEILKELVILESQDFGKMNADCKKLATVFTEFSELADQIDKDEQRLKMMQGSLCALDLDARTAFTAFIALPMLYSIWGSLSGEYFSAYVGLSMLFCALDQYYLNGAISSNSLWGYIFSGVVGKLCKGKDTLLATGNSVFAMDDHNVASLIAPNACRQGDLLTCGGEECYCVGPDGVRAFTPGGSQVAGWGLSAYVPSVVVSTASYVSKFNSALLVGSSLLHLTTLDKRIAHKKGQSILSGKKKKMAELLNQFIRGTDDLIDFIKYKNLKLFSRAIIGEQEDLAAKVRCFAALDVFLGLASLLRESNKKESGSIKFKFGFVDFVEQDQNKNRFEMSINNICHFLKFKPKDEYKAAVIFAKNYIYPKLVFGVTEDNEFFVDSKPCSQYDFLTKFISPIYAQMLLAHSFGIVWGESAKMKFIDMRRLSFISNPDKTVFQVIFPQ